MAAASTSVTLWYAIAGGLFVLMALSGSVLSRLPLSTALVYMVAGYAIGPSGLGLLNLNPLKDAKFLEHLTEVAVLISLFTAGLKLRPGLRDRVWRPAFLLATAGMVLTVGALALVGWLLLKLPLGAAVLLGAILAPTDPVLASDVQAKDPNDRDRVRFSLTGEAGLNDGTAFPFVMLGLGLLGLHDLGAAGWRWLTLDLLWATAAGLGVGTALGMAVARLVLFLRREHKEAVGLDDFLSLGLIGTSYGLALLVHGYGFLAVFAAGLALRREERRQDSGEGAAVSTSSPPIARIAGSPTDPDADPATHPTKASAYMAQKVLEFNEGLERIFEVGVVVVVGSMLSARLISWEAAGLAAFLFLLARPGIAAVCLAATSLRPRQLRLIAWFGIRGIGSFYYLAYALNHGVSAKEAGRLSDLVLAMVACSIVLHGMTSTPFMRRYQERRSAARRDSVATPV